TAVLPQLGAARVRARRSALAVQCSVADVWPGHTVMKWSLRLARVSGIDIRVHVTFGFVLLFGALQYGEVHGARGAWFGAIFMCCLFACVALHELGHSLVAQRLGLRVKEIVLLPIGGIARLSRDPKKPLHELLIA